MVNRNEVEGHFCVVFIMRLTFANVQHCHPVSIREIMVIMIDGA
jgi:hypothetical protein